MFVYFWKIFLAKVNMLLWNIFQHLPPIRMSALGATAAFLSRSLYLDSLSFPLTPVPPTPVLTALPVFIPGASVHHRTVRVHKRRSEVVFTVSVAGSLTFDDQTATVQYVALVSCLSRFYLIILFLHPRLQGTLEGRRWLCTTV